MRSPALSALLLLGLSTVSVVAEEPFGGTAAPVLREFCVGCHGGAKPKSGLALDRPPADAGKTVFVWKAVQERLAEGSMPPRGKPRPSPEQRKQLDAWLRQELARADAPNLGGSRVVLRRLNRVEYENTVRDLLGIDIPLRHLLPEDTPGHGFDTVAEGLHLSTVQMEKYLEAADVALDAAFRFSPAPEVVRKRFSFKEEREVRNNLDIPPDAVTDPVTMRRHVQIFRELDDAVVFYSDTYSPTVLRQFSPARDGTYRVRFSGYAYRSLGRPVGVRFYGEKYPEKRLLAYFEMPPDKPRVVEFTARLSANEQLHPVPYQTGYDARGKSVWQVGAHQFEGVGLAVEWLEVEGPLFDRWPPPGLTRLFEPVPVRPIAVPANRRRDRNAKAFAVLSADPKADARTVLLGFATRAFRRPVQPDEIAAVVRLVEDALAAGTGFEDALRIGFKCLLASPAFLFLEETPGPLSDHAVASRLSYFLWSTLPDAELLRLAEQKKLRDPTVLRAQTERLLRDPRARAFVENFVGQWLDLRRIDATSPDMRLYPEFDELLKRSMVREPEEFFAELLEHDLSLDNVVDSDFVMIDGRLAEHYGIEGVSGEQFRKVAVPPGSHRGGVLTQAGVLKVTANGTVTSPVLRGVWVQKRILGRTPSPPPPNIPAVEPDTRGATTIRELLAKHRDSATCASCHARIDPPGFALESFDVIGGWRDRYRSIEKGDPVKRLLHGRRIWEYRDGPSVDASGELPDGRSFRDIDGFKKLLLADGEQITRNLAEQLLTYATGAGIRPADRPEVERVVGHVRANGNGLRTLMHAVVASRLFLEK